MNRIQGSGLLLHLMGLATLLLVFLLALRPGLSMASLMRDTTTTAGLHPLAGVLSNLGVLLWCVATAVTGFSALVLRASGQKVLVRYFATGSMISAYLLVDDFFLVHEHLGSFLGIGWGEHLVYLVLGVAVFSYLFVFRWVIFGTRFMLLLMGLGFLGASVVVDMFQPWLLWMDSWRNLLEDGFKWMGIVGWCSYHWVTVQGVLLGIWQKRSGR